MSAVAGRRPVHIGGLSDDELVRLARAGDEGAFDAIVHRYRAPLVGYCRRWLDAHRAEEVVQHTLMKAFLCVRDDDRPLTLRPWLYRVAHNAALNALEKKGSDWEQLDENYDGVPQPPQVAEQRARFLRVVGQIDALPSRQREALLLNEFEGRCYAEIATELGTSESGVRGLLRRARRQLRDAAALVLPFPALRELARADGRGLQLERAGELIGTAGAAGGVGAAGAFTKVAAGVLAAGTIAGGGVAIEKRVRDVPPVPRTEAAERQKPKFAPADEVRRTLLVGVVDKAAGPFGTARETAERARPVAGARVPTAGTHGGTSLGGIESQGPQADTPGQIAPEPIAPTLPLLPVLAAPEQQPASGETTNGETTEGGEPGTTPPADEQASSTNGGTAPPPDESSEPAGPLVPRQL